MSIPKKAICDFQRQEWVDGRARVTIDKERVLCDKVEQRSSRGDTEVGWL